MARTRNSDTDAQNDAQKTSATIVAQGRTKKVLTQKRKGRSTKGVQVPRVEREEGVDNDEQVPQDPVPPPTIAPTQATISPELGQMFNVVNSAMDMFKAFMVRKQHRGRMKGISHRGNHISFGKYALQALEPAWITSRQIEAGRRAMTRNARRGGKIWVRIFPKTMIEVRLEYGTRTRSF
uniref:Uncharacterized protein LOC104214856 n=1 Tax=Nicotiana sylvestris TaxID=4096 RepID=A0A1U7VD66_NICSY|nr:PREDICTED: uncharacterized protein LOC104214856 [Nicotiana sylvestris]